ncbi:MAG: zinc ribbon domain-containing protein [Bryobacterales bacterium]|nr:zinc ribbon domain-containing protein [Bryobacterales bacterium]
MPMYEYRCEKCGKTFEKLRRMSDADKDLECPDCHSEKVERQVSGFAMTGCGGGSGRFR